MFEPTSYRTMHQTTRAYLLPHHTSRLLTPLHAHHAPLQYYGTSSHKIKKNAAVHRDLLMQVRVCAAAA